MKLTHGVVGPLGFALGVLLVVCTPAAHAQTFSNTEAITFPTNSSDGRATTYPSTIDVAGAPFTITYVGVTLHGLTHTYVEDVAVLLVSPAGQRIVLMANTHSSGRANNNTLTFLPDATKFLPLNTLFANVVSGAYACSTSDPGIQFPAPAPGGPPLTSLAPVLGTNANGTWRLYVWDRTPLLDNGFLAGGWSITFNQAPAQVVPTAFTYQGRLLGVGGTPLSDAANVRFTLFNSETAAPLFSAVSEPITRSFADITDGVISTTLEFGEIIDTSQALWLGIEVESPPGSGFAQLTPRQPITATPQARVAQFATTAAQLAPGRLRIRGDAGPVSGSPGIWLSSPVNVPVDRAFIGMRDDSNVGFFNGNWNLLLHANGNVAIGNATGFAPSQRLVVNGNVLANNLAVPSSGRFKHNVAPIADALDKLLRLDGVTFDWNADFAKDRPGREHDIGFVAEDVAEIFPEVVFKDADGNVTGMDYSRLTAVAVQAIKELKAEQLKQLQTLQAQNAALQERLDKIERAIGQNR